MELDSLSMVSDNVAVALQDPDIAQLVEILKNSQGSEFPFNFNVDLVAIFGVIGIFFVPFIAILLIVWFILNHKRKESKLRAEVITKAIEHGQTIPDNLFETKKTKEKKSTLKKGIIWSTAGLGISTFFLIAARAIEPTAIGIIPLFIGIGYLLIHFLDKEQATKEENDSDK